MSQDRPSVGRMVHYVSHGTPVLEDGTQAFPSVCRAAVVTEVGGPNDWAVGLCVLNPTGIFFHEATLYSLRELPGTWHWPERV